MFFSFHLSSLLSKYLKTSIVAALISLCFIGCARSSSTTRSASKRMCISMDPTTFDPRKNADPCTSTFHFLLYEGLTRIRPDGSAELALADSIDLSQDKKTYTFHLKKAKWSDGAPITAHDFEHSWKKTLSPNFGSPCPYLLYPIKGAEAANLGKIPESEIAVRALDDQTLVVELENPTPYFLSLITFCNFYPIPKHIEEKNPKWDLSGDHNQVFSGPFLLEKWQRNQEISLKKNPHYWNAPHVQLEHLTLSIVSSDRTAVQMFERGEVDYVDTITSSLSTEDLAYCNQKGLLRVKPLGALLFCTFNLDRFPFQNAHIRKALSLAIDRDAIVQNITHLSEVPATFCVPPVLFQNEKRKLFASYDPEFARQELEKGLAELNTTKEKIGEALILTYEGDSLYRKIAQTIQHQWKVVLNLSSTLSELERKTLLTKHMQKNYAVGIDRFYAQYFDPNNLLERFKHKAGIKNLPGFHHPSYISLLDEANRSIDPTQRIHLLQEAEKLLANEMPIAPLFSLNLGYLMNQEEYDQVAFSPLGNILIKDILPKK